ncbi:hypothetical protein [Flavobacterium sp.]|uniref:hypothetical protein n=1 Tax=Flavobacterium sp. TaxID=239 RepID=UPI00261E4A5D|nr:hypothetical protein [Flavobacterium sp.]
MTLDPSTGSIISVEQAKKMITLFAEKFPNQTVSSFIGGDNVKNILEQEGCIGIRIYNGYNEELEKISLIMVGVNKEEEDMLNNGIIYDQMVICPPACPKVGLI